MSDNEEQLLILNKEKIGIAIVLMEDVGPQTYLNLSPLDEISSMYLAVKGFTAFMTGFETNIYGPGKIRGILEIPDTGMYAVAMDLNMRGTGFEEDERLQVNRMGVVCLIANNEQLAMIRRYYLETEQFLIEKLKAVATVNHLNESFCQRIKDEYNQLLVNFITKTDKEKLAESEKRSLFEIDVLLSLPRDENMTARVIMDATQSAAKGITLSEISKRTKRKQKIEQEMIDRLLEKGLIIAIPPKSEKMEIKYIAQ